MSDTSPEAIAALVARIDAAIGCGIVAAETRLLREAVSALEALARERDEAKAGLAACKGLENLAKALCEDAAAEIARLREAVAKLEDDREWGIAQDGVTYRSVTIDGEEYQIPYPVAMAMVARADENTRLRAAHCDAEKALVRAGEAIAYLREANEALARERDEALENLAKALREDAIAEIARLRAENERLQDKVDELECRLDEIQSASQDTL